MASCLCAGTHRNAMAKDEEYRRLINTSRWRALRRSVLSAHPLCAACEASGLLSAATEVHHIVPVEYGVNRAEKERLMFSPMNLRPLCHGCHVEAHRAMGRSGRAATARRRAAQVEAIRKRFFGDDPPDHPPGGDF